MRCSLYQMMPSHLMTERGKYCTAERRRSIRAGCSLFLRASVCCTGQRTSPPNGEAFSKAKLLHRSLSLSRSPQRRKMEEKRVSDNVSAVNVKPMLHNCDSTVKRAVSCCVALRKYLTLPSRTTRWLTSKQRDPLPLLTDGPRDPFDSIGSATLFHMQLYVTRYRCRILHDETKQQKRCPSF